MTGGAGALRSYRRVYTSDGGQAYADTWLQPRYSYSDGWTPATSPGSPRSNPSLAPF